MIVSYNRVEYLESQIDVNEQELKDKFKGNIISYIKYYEDESDNPMEYIERIGVFDVDIELLY